MKASHPTPTGRACPPSEVDHIEGIVAGEDVLIGELISSDVCWLPISSSHVATTTGRPKRTLEQSLDVIAEAMSTLSGHVTELQQQMLEVQQKKLNNSWAHVEALTQGGKNNLVSPGAHSRIQPTRSQLTFPST